MKTIWMLILAASLIFTSLGCKEDDGITLPPLTNNEFSSLWDGVYVGHVTYTGALGAVSYPEATIRIKDIGDNYVWAALYLNPRPIDYTPTMQQDVQVISKTVARIDVTDTDHKRYFVALSRANTVISGSMYVIGAEGSPAWRAEQISAQKPLE